MQTEILRMAAVIDKRLRSFVFGSNLSELRGGGVSFPEMRAGAALSVPYL